MSDKVVSLNGDPINTGTPDPRVVKSLAAYLEMAHAGEVVGIALAAQHADGSSSEVWSGVANLRTIGALFTVMQRITFALDR